MGKMVFSGPYSRLGTESNYFSFHMTNQSSPQKTIYLVFFFLLSSFVQSQSLFDILHGLAFSFSSHKLSLFDQVLSLTHLSFSIFFLTFSFSSSSLSIIYPAKLGTSQYREAPDDLAFNASREIPLSKGKIPQLQCHIPGLWGKVVCSPLNKIRTP